MRPVRPLALITTLLAGCFGDVPTDNVASAQCSIDTAGEKTPGYPFDLDRYNHDVLPIFTSTCAVSGCHAAPSGTAGFTVWAAAAPGNCDYARTFNTMKSFVDLAKPTNSPIYVALSGGDAAHPVQLAAGDAKLAKITAFLDDASKRYLADGGNGTTPPPGASPFDYAVFQATIQPALDGAEAKGCGAVGCHGSGAAGLTIVAGPAQDSAEAEANFTAITARTNLADPATSLIYLKATTRHAGGSSVLLPAKDAKAMLAWIEAAAASTGNTQALCADPSRFNPNVFRDQILPILRGDVDLNHPGQAVTTGCTQGSCHGVDRPPGSLILKATSDVATNLKNFACFVDLTSPSASQVLMCPSDDPTCVHAPHPGAKVFAGADDLNYQRVLSYLFAGKPEAAPLDFAFFVRRINPIYNDRTLVDPAAGSRTCADNTACHGVAVAGQAAPNGSNFGIIANASDPLRTRFNFVSTANFTTYGSPAESSLFLYPTNEIADLANHPRATGLPHPGGAPLAVDSQAALDILRWANGLRPDAQGQVRDFLVAGEYPATRVTDATGLDEPNLRPTIFDKSSGKFNGGEWDGLFSDAATVDLAAKFPGTGGRVFYAVAYLLNSTPAALDTSLTVSSPNPMMVYVDGTVVATTDGGTASFLVPLPAFRTAKAMTRILVKVFQPVGTTALQFALQVNDAAGAPITDQSGKVLIKLGSEGGF